MLKSEVLKLEECFESWSVVTFEHPGGVGEVHLQQVVDLLQRHVQAHGRARAVTRGRVTDPLLSPP